MSGVFPDGGVPASSTSNAVDVDTNCSTELFYSTARCNPRFEPAAMNAMISEILNVMACAGHTYDCGTLTNLCSAIRRLTGARNIQEGDVVHDGNIVQSSDDVLLWNCTGADITVGANTTASGLEAQGFCLVDTFATAGAATGGGVDSFGNVYQIGDPVITFPNGDTLTTVAQGGAGGAPNATTNIVGVVELATSAEITEAVDTGGAGPISVTPGRMSGASAYGFGGGAQGPLDPSNDRVWMRDASDGKMYWVPMDRIPSGPGLGPFSPGQTAGDWSFVQSVTDPNGSVAVAPAGPAGVPGYWEVTEAHNTTGADVFIQGDPQQDYAQPGDQIAIPAGGRTTVRLHWRHSE
jgi:hypothetical protein